MANDISARPWSLDTASATPVWTAQVKIEHIEMSGYAAQGNIVIVRDVNGKVIWQATGADDLSEVRSGKIGWTRGLVLTTLDSGLVLVYIE